MSQRIQLVAAGKGYDSGWSVVSVIPTSAAPAVSSGHFSYTDAVDCFRLILVCTSDWPQERETQTCKTSECKMYAAAALNATAEVNAH